MPNNNPQYTNESSLMEAIIAKLREYCKGWFPSKKTEVNELINQYEKKEISGYQSLVGRLSLIFGVAGGALSKIKKEIAKMVAGYRQQADTNEASSSSSAASSSSSAASTSADSTQVDISFLFNSDKNAVILQLGQALLEGNAIHSNTFVDIAKAYPEATRDAFLTLREQCEQAINQQNSAFARTLLGLMYKHGLGVEQDYPKAISLYEQAIALGNLSAMYNLALMYYHGQGVKQDYPTAISLYKQAIALGNSGAMNNLAYMYKYGQGVAQDYPKAISLYEQAIALGNSGAMNNLATMYHQGLGDKKNLSKAAELYQMAADNGIEAAAKQLKVVQRQMKNTNPVVANHMLSEGDSGLIKQYFQDTFNVFCNKIEGDKEAVTIQLSLPKEFIGQLIDTFSSKGAQVTTSEDEKGQLKVTIKKLSYDVVRILSLEINPASGMNEASLAASSSGQSAPEPESPEMEGAETEAAVSIASSSQGLFSQKDNSEKEQMNPEDEQEEQAFHTPG